MRQTIWKYPLNPETELSMPGFARIVHIGGDPQGQLCAWAIVEPDSKDVTKKTLLVCGTGHSIPSEVDAVHIGTCVVGIFVWHIFEKI